MAGGIEDSKQFRVYHGTPYSWRDPTAHASYDRPLHVASDTDLPGDYAFHVGGYDPAEDWEAMQSGHIKEFSVSPTAKIHHTDTPHADAVLPQHEHEMVKHKGYDMTMFHGGLGIVYNPHVLTHTRDIHFKEHRRSDPAQEMEWMHGEDWRDYV